MNNRTLVYMTFQNGISIRTISHFRKSPHHFHILRSEIEELERTSELILHDIHSFAVLRRDVAAETIEIKLTWLLGDTHSLSGYQETLVLPYEQVKAFLNKSILENRPIVWKTLSLDFSNKHPQLIFKSKKNLQDAIADNTIRHKLACSMRDKFHWSQAEKIEFYDDFLPYSFLFQEIKNGKPAITGGLILHQQNDMQKAYYSIHT